MMRSDKESVSPWWFLLLLLAYFGMGVWMTVRLPALATPNELLNFEYIQVMRQIKGLPNRGLVDSEVRYTEWHQPPLYFTFAALAGLPVPVPPAESNPPPPIVWPANPAYLATHQGNLNPVVHITPQNTPLLYTSRIAATLLGLLGLAALYRAGRTVYGTAVALLMAGLLAFQPNYIHLSGSVNNDMPLTAVAALVMSYTILIIHADKGPRWYFGLGLLAAAAILTKANGVFVLAYLGAAWLIVLLRHRNWQQTIRSALFTLAGLVPLWAGWLALNTIRMHDALGVEGSLPVGRVLALNPADFMRLTPWLDDIGRSFWLDWSAGDVGYGPDWFYILWATLFGIGLLGWLRPAGEVGRRSITFTVLLGILAISYLYFAVKALTVKEAGFLVPEGRWWLPVMPGLAWLTAVGYGRWWPEAKRNRALLFSAAVPALSTLVLLALHLPALYPQARQLPATTGNSEQPLLTYDDTFALLSAAAPPLTADTEGRVELTWQALADIDRDYIIAAQLLTPAAGGRQKLDEQYSYPGYGRNPTTGWQTGDIYQDSLTLLPSGPLAGPTLAQLVLHVQEDGRNLPARMRDTAVDPPIVLPIIVRPALPLQPEAPLPEPVRFGEAFSLAGAQTERDGEDLLVTLWWRAEQPGSHDYTIFVHALDEQGHLLTQSDRSPAAGASPTSIWQTGDVIRDVHRLPGAARSAGLLVGAYDPLSGQRLAAWQGDQVLPDASYQIGVAP
jgi:4-amino-4-deoxy-L-arabinose transferase-like glycosyltransferase